MKGTHQRYFPALDGLRALAIFMVFTAHYLPAFTPLRNWGLLGVDLFFVLSGFLITGILFDTQDSPHRFRNFYMRRILRIWPVYYGVWCALLLLEPVFRWRFEPGLLLWLGHLGNWARYLFFDPVFPPHLEMLTPSLPRNWMEHAYFGHFWTLCVEEQFYLVWPLIVFSVRDRRRLLQIATAVVLLEPLLRLFLYWHAPFWMIRNELLMRTTVTRLDALLLGGILALLLRGPARPWIEAHSHVISATCLLPFLAVLWEYLYRTRSPYANLNDISLGTIGFSATGLLGVAFVVQLIRDDGPLVRFFSLAPLVFLGEISYGFYVYHDLPHDFYGVLGAKLARTSIGIAWWAAAIGFVSTLLLSWLSFRFFETPILRFKKRFESRSSASATPTPSHPILTST